MDTATRAGLIFDVVDSPALGGPPDPATVVCLHGFPQDARAFTAVTPLLTRAGLRVLTPDQRGYSPRARPTGRRAYVLRELVHDVLALLDTAGVERAHVVGHDWGGVVGWALAAWYPHRVRSLTAVSTPHPAALRAASLRGTQAAHSAYVAAFQLPFAPERLLLARSGHVLADTLQRSGLPRDMAHRYAARQREPGALTAALAWYRALPLGGPSVGTVSVPVRYLHGRHDPFFSRAAVLGTAGHVTGPFERRTLDTGHWVPESRPDAVAAAVLDLARG
ncbi:MAG: alpha/beta fold hydrolase [Janthinobacterium lividum]